jgi:hypothetical protein
MTDIQYRFPRNLAVEFCSTDTLAGFLLSHLRRALPERPCIVRESESLHGLHPGHPRGVEVRIPYCRRDER